MDIKKTRSGLTPSTVDEVPYTIKTSFAEEYLQKLFDTMNARLREKTGDQELYQDFNVSLITLSCSKKFKPMMAILPTSVLKSKTKKKSEKEAAIFSTSNGEDMVYVQEHVFAVMAPFLYDKKDAEAFGSNAVRHHLGISTKIPYSIKGNRLPCIQRLNGGRSEVVVVMIDPLRLFHHMLDTKDSPENFEVDIVKTEQIKSTNYRYEVLKVYRTGKSKKRKRNDGDRIAYELQQRIAGFGGR